MFERIIDFDYRAFKLLNSLAGRSQWGDSALVFSAEFVIFLLVAGLALFVLLEKKNRKREIAVVLALCAGAFGRVVLDSIVRILYFRPRPFLVAAVNQLVYHNPAEASFPSGHATFMFAMAFAVFFNNKKWGAVYLILALISSLSRVAVGVHYPLDIAAGILMGFISAVALSMYHKHH